MKKITLLLLGIAFALSACNKTDQKKAGISESDAKDVEKIWARTVVKAALFLIKPKSANL